MTEQYSIGQAGKPWDQEEKQQWLLQQTKKRDYFEDIVPNVTALNTRFQVEQYGVLKYENHYPVYALKSAPWCAELPIVLVTGGVHGYETSGVLGALAFAKKHAHTYQGKFNLVVLPCISPWGYETINRWNPLAVDPNRSFHSQSPAEESGLAMDYVNGFQEKIILHIDLHETTDTDNSEFRPALAARDGKVNHNWNIPDGFYLVGHSQKPEAEFQRHIINTVKKVTHIAEADENNALIGVPVEQFGVINYDATKLGLCMGMTSAPYVTTTEVYPDSPNTTPKNCVDGQVASIEGAISYLNSIM
ncbi:MULTISPECIES: M14 family metallocarboxypeptidase [unclassified Pseudoalteromonas]|uniref:M14 family metallopeptidase n=1 Tax=unclassified Pseudoalteromonas TaxID=194690 RepID=UPI00209725B1|nr:M14 family metallocarboxypeptidase [Pseudoalteromonas sp. XMcav2-N]MCO7187119.1 M14 family metallocarboxypeptidase [Pseudoalteromonas sp. XMcav2-N]